MFPPDLTDFQLPDDFFQTAQKYLTGVARLNESLNLISFETEDVLWSTWWTVSRSCLTLWRKKPPGWLMWANAI